MNRTRSVWLTVLISALCMAPAAGSEEPGWPRVVPTILCGEYFLIPIEVDLDGDGEPTTLHALFDTGGNSLHIDPDAIVRAGGARVPERKQVTIRNATAGDLTFNKLRPYTLELDHLSRPLGIEVDIFLPFRAFDDFLLTLDFPAREMRIDRGRLPRPDGKSVFNARGRDRRPYLDVKLAGEKRRLLIDSGSSDSFALKDGSDLPWDGAPLPLGVMQGMDRVHYRDVGRVDTTVEIAGVEIPRPVVSTNARTDLFGTQVMRRFAWTFDQKRRRVRIVPDSTEPLQLAARRGTGAVMTPVETGFEVRRILPDTPAAGSDLEVGDLVVAVDGESVLDRDCSRWEPDLSPQRTLTVRRGERTFEVEIEVVELVP
jgi:hypothetical protein